MDDEDENDDEIETVSSQSMNKTGSKSELTKSQAKDILFGVWNKIQCDSDEFESTEKVFNDLSLNQEIYENALNVLSNKLTVVLKRQPNELWTNQYNPCLLNVGMQIWISNSCWTLSVALYTLCHTFQNLKEKWACF